MTAQQTKCTLSYLGTDLVTTLASLEMDDFTHVFWRMIYHTIQNKDTILLYFSRRMRRNRSITSFKSATEKRLRNTASAQ